MLITYFNTLTDFPESTKKKHARNISLSTITIRTIVQIVYLMSDCILICTNKFFKEKIVYVEYDTDKGTGSIS